MTDRTAMFKLTYREIHKHISTYAYIENWHFTTALRLYILHIDHKGYTTCTPSHKEERQTTYLVIMTITVILLIQNYSRTFLKKVWCKIILLHTKAFPYISLKGLKYIQRTGRKLQQVTDQNYRFIQRVPNI